MVDSHPYWCPIQSPPNLNYWPIFEFEEAKSIYSAWRLHLSTAICWVTLKRACACTPKNTPQNQPHHQRLPPRSIFGGFWNPKWQNQSKRVDRPVRQQGGEHRRAVLLQGGGLSTARAHPKKYTPKSATSSKASPSVNNWRISKSEVAKRSSVGYTCCHCMHRASLWRMDNTVWL